MQQQQQLRRRRRGRRKRKKELQVWRTPPLAVATEAVATGLLRKGRQIGLCLCWKGRLRDKMRMRMRMRRIVKMNGKGWSGE